MEELGAADLLEQGATVIDDDGWCTGQLVDDHGRHCAIGALHQAEVNAGLRRMVGWTMTEELCGPKGHIREAITALAREVVDSDDDIDGHLFSADVAVVAWNNGEAEDAAEVADAMRRAAKKLRNEASPL